MYLPGMEVRLDTGATISKATRYYSHGGQTVAMRTGAGVTFLSSDHHGTAQLAVDAATGNFSQRRFAPFGQPRGTATGTWPGEKGFVGGTIDASADLTHLGAREYDPATGRFISVDPIMDVADPQQMNGYAYAHNSPITRSDPTGLYDPDCPGRTRNNGYTPTSPVADSYKRRNRDDASCANGCRPVKRRTTGTGEARGGGCSGVVAYKTGGCNWSPASIFDQSPRYMPSSTLPPANIDWWETSKFTALFFSAVFFGPEELAAAGILRSIAWAVRAARAERAVRKASDAANTGSRLAEASSAAFRAADSVGDFTVSAKHLPGAGGRWSKWAEGVDINGTIANALRSDTATFLPNAGGAADSFIVRTNVGSVIGTKGQTYVKAVIQTTAASSRPTR